MHCMPWLTNNLFMAIIVWGLFVDVTNLVVNLLREGACVRVGKKRAPPIQSNRTRRALITNSKSPSQGGD